MDKMQIVEKERRRIVIIGLPNTRKRGLGGIKKRGKVVFDLLTEVLLMSLKRRANG